MDIPIDGDAVISSGMGVCDFCENRNPTVWQYPCKDFELPIPSPFDRHVPLSTGDWGACNECSELIEKGHKEKLARRAKTAYKLGYQQKVVDLFFQHRIDKPRFKNPQPYVPFDDLHIYPDVPK